MSFRLRNAARPFATARAAAVSAPTVDALEVRQMLSGLVAQTGQTVYEVPAGERLLVPADFRGDIVANVQGGGRVSFDTGASVQSATINTVSLGNGDETLTYVGRDAFIENLTVNGKGLSERLRVTDGATVAVATFNGFGGEDQVRVDRFGTLGTATLNTGTQNDRIDIAGNVTGRLQIDMFNGDDLAIFRGTATIGSVAGGVGLGNDRVFASNDTVGTFRLRLAGGDDRAFIRSGFDVGGDLELRFDGGKDRLDMFGGDMSVAGDMTVTMSDGIDSFRARGVDVGGDQNVDMGKAEIFNRGRNREEIFFGEDTVGGDSRVVFRSNATIREFGNRQIGGAYELLGGRGAALARLEQNSRAENGFTFENRGTTVFSSNVDVGFQGARIRTGEFDDEIFILGGTQIVGNLDIFTAGADDVVVFSEGQVDITGDLLVNTGWGSDFFSYNRLFVDGNADVTLENNDALEGFNIAALGSGVFTGNTDFTLRGPGRLTEVTHQIIGGDYQIDGTFGPLRVRTDAGTTVGGDFLYLNFGDNDLVAGFTVAGEARFLGGDGSDSFDLAGLDVGGVLDVATGGNDDFVSLLDSVFEDKVSVLLGDGDDLLLNGNSVFNGESFLDGGDGRDRLQDFDNGFNVNFEAGV